MASPSTEPRRSRTFVTAFARGLSVIEAFGVDHKSLSVADTADRVGLDRAVTRRLLLTLVELGFARPNGRQFELTSELRRAMRQENLELVIEPRIGFVSDGAFTQPAFFMRL